MTINRRSIASRVECCADLRVGRPLRPPLEREQQPFMVVGPSPRAVDESVGVGYRHTIWPLSGAKGQMSRIEPLGFALTVALANLLSEVPRVPLGKRAYHSEKQKTLWSGIVQFRLQHRDEADLGLAQTIHAFQSR